MLCRSLRDLPSLGRLLERPDLVALCEVEGQSLVKFILRERLETARRDLQQGLSVELEDLLDLVKYQLKPSYCRLINATGTVLHTNLGRAPLGDALEEVARRLKGYSALEYDLRYGKRGHRGQRAEDKLRALTGVEAALVVNNCASALLLLLTALAKGGDVVVSRGELIEIGGGFRIPEVLRMSGASLVEVGTTNRTSIDDYRKAVGERTALLLKTHSSNFTMTGFTQAPASAELIALGKEVGIPVVFDLGSGMLTKVGIAEPGVLSCQPFAASVFSGDKLLGGPQCGIIIGKRDIVASCRSHPLFRALRCDKLTLALLEEVLRRHAACPMTIATLRLITAPALELKSRAQKLAEQLLELKPKVVKTLGQVGGGSDPGGKLPSWGLALKPKEGEPIELLQRRLRLGSPAVIARTEKERVVIDLRAVFPDEDEELAGAIRRSFT